MADFTVEEGTTEFWDEYEEFVDQADEYRAIHGETPMPPYMAEQLDNMRNVLLQLDESHRALEDGDFESFDSVDDAIDYLGLDEEE